MSESNKIKQEELDHYRDLVVKKNSVKIELANITVHMSELETAKQYQIMRLKEAEKEAVEYEAQLKDQYGMESLDLHTGEYQLAEEKNDNP